jgi:hypothetical protein
MLGEVVLRERDVACRALRDEDVAEADGPVEVHDHCADRQHPGRVAGSMP